VRYHRLVAPLAEIRLPRRGASGHFWSMAPVPHSRAFDAQMYRFLVELQTGTHWSLLRDVMGPAFAPSGGRRDVFGANAAMPRHTEPAIRLPGTFHNCAQKHARFSTSACLDGPARERQRDHSFVGRKGFANRCWSNWSFARRARPAKFRERSFLVNLMRQTSFETVRGHAST